MFGCQSITGSTLAKPHAIRLVRDVGAPRKVVRGHCDPVRHT
jgi:hypothetical protein